MSHEDTLARYLAEWRLSDMRRYKLKETRKKLEDERAVRARLKGDYEAFMEKHDSEEQQWALKEVAIRDKNEALEGEIK